MVEVSLGEMVVVAGVGIALVGRKDLPYVSNYVGKQIGRFVGMLQGARHKMDKAAEGTSELRQLSAELRSGLRELDAVKTELAVASTVGRGFGNGMMMPRMNKTPIHATDTISRRKNGGDNSIVPDHRYNSSGLKKTSIESLSSSGLVTNATSSTEESAPLQEPSTDQSMYTTTNLAPRSHAVAAVAEEEWEKRGIGFKSRAEKGTFGGWKDETGGTNQIVGGASILDDLMRQSLIYDQYDRTVKEQDDILQSKIENRIRRRNDEENSDNKSGKDPR